MTVNKLMEHTSLSRAAFYYHFADIHDLMEILLARLSSEVMAASGPWFSEEGDPVKLIYESLRSSVEVISKHGPLLKAVRDSAGSDARMEEVWCGFLSGFDDAVAERILADQQQGLIDAMDARPVASMLDNANVALYIQEFGSAPYGQKDSVLATISRVWISTLYGPQWVANCSSTLYRKQEENVSA